MRKVILMLLSLPFVGCGAQPGKVAKEAIKVNVMEVGRSTSQVAMHYVGVVEESSSASMSFLSAGTISEFYMHKGQPVKKGQLLVRLTAPSVEQSLLAAKATYEQALDAHTRMKKLYDSKSLPELKYIEVVTALKQAEASYEIAKNEKEDMSLYAPFDGVIGEKSASIGEVVLPAQPILTLLQTKDAMVKIAVPEQDRVKISQGDKALISVAVLGGEEFDGTVAWNGIVTDPISHTYEIMIDVAGSDSRLLPGMLCSVDIMLDAPTAHFVIPNRAVSLDDNNRRFVWLIEGGKALRREIEVGDLTSTGVAVTKGLKEGDKYVVDGQQKLSNGLSVEVK